MSFLFTVITYRDFLFSFIVSALRENLLFSTDFNLNGREKRKRAKKWWIRSCFYPYHVRFTKSNRAIEICYCCVCCWISPVDAFKPCIYCHFNWRRLGADLSSEKDTRKPPSILCRFQISYIFRFLSPWQEQNTVCVFEWQSRVMNTASCSIQCRNFLPPS